MLCEHGDSPKLCRICELEAEVERLRDELVRIVAINSCDEEMDDSKEIAVLREVVDAASIYINDNYSPNGHILDEECCDLCNLMLAVNAIQALQPTTKLQPGEQDARD